jgi:hypothetical protein
MPLVEVGARYVFDVTDLGRRCLVLPKIKGKSPPPIAVLLNWLSPMR